MYIAYSIENMEEPGITFIYTMLWLRVRMGEIQHDASARNTTTFNRASKIYTYDSDAHARINKSACKL